MPTTRQHVLLGAALICGEALLTAGLAPAARPLQPHAAASKGWHPRGRGRVVSLGAGTDWRASPGGGSSSSSGEAVESSVEKELKADEPFANPANVLDPAACSEDLFQDAMSSDEDVEALMRESGFPDALRTPYPNGDPTMGVFCSRTLNLRNIEVVGYDMDYTLVRYKVSEWEERAYHYAKEWLCEKGFYVSGLQFKMGLVCRGLVVDKVEGNLLKVDRFGYVRDATHGTRRLTQATLAKLYGSGVAVDLRDKERWSFLNTLFSVSEATIYLQLVDRLDDGSLLEKSAPPFEAFKCNDYYKLFGATSKAVFRAHVTSKLKSEVLRNPGQFIEIDPGLVRTLLDQRLAGKKLALITNSDWPYTERIMRYIITEQQGEEEGGSSSSCSTSSVRHRVVSLAIVTSANNDRPQTCKKAHAAARHGRQARSRNAPERSQGRGNKVTRNILAEATLTRRRKRENLTHSVRTQCARVCECLGGARQKRGGAPKVAGTGGEKWGAAPKISDWRALFDVVVVSARKPDFFTGNLPVYEVVEAPPVRSLSSRVNAGDDDAYECSDLELLAEDADGVCTPVLREVFKMEEGKVYSGGTARMVEKLFKVGREAILFVGDHVFADVTIAKETTRWRTLLVLQELEEEVDGLARSHKIREELKVLLRRKDRAADFMNHLLTILVRIDHAAEHRGLEAEEEEERRRSEELKPRVLAVMRKLDDDIQTLLEEYNQNVNENWGYLSRAGFSDKSHLMRQIEKYADVYTSRVSNLLRYTPFAYFRAGQQSLAHDGEDLAAHLEGLDLRSLGK
eukprot:CAMPEP_0172645748 /NCGR_PEP_ID=MMETSP1068-20121228/239888_1 /TAXON_ID=35684 /ORGANISM="Pseudopedinella elastica, Strain CCMP716" /LENGTH=794 /DNA_ID=CAMNT_0013459993 /DNA_START=133 /DNA_END=2517 /DNA_ORIENTATION=-